MFNFFKRKRNKKGFTLVELLTVMFVVGAIAAVALPSYKRAMEKSRAAQGIATLESIAKAQMNHNVLRGNFSPTFNGLPIELRDNESAVVTGSEFSDNYFDFTLSDTDSIAVAKRQNGEYELSVDYVTGRLYCSPATNSVCMRFGLEERDASVGQGGMGGSTTTPEISDGRVCEGGYCYDYKDGQQVSYCVADSNGKDCIKDGTYCDKDSQTCKTYQDGKLVKTCRSNTDFSGCDEKDTGVIPGMDGLVCGEKTCNYWQNGKIVGTCDAYRGEPTSKCYDTFGLSGVVCEAGKCTTYANGKPILTCSKEEGFCVDNNGEKCIINDLGNACKEKTEGKEGLVCNEKECIFYDKEGNPIGSCSAENEGENPDCYKAFGLSGKFCDEKMCYEFENGQIKGECPATNNGENKECYEAFGLSGRICDEKMCYEIENGKIQGQCSSENDGENRECYEAFKLSGTLCDDKGCGVFDKGEMVMVCDKESKMCTDLKTGEKCAANATFDGCKPLIGFVCNKEGCTYYDEDGKPQGTCPSYGNGKPKIECYDKFGLSGEVCDDVGNCYTYENGTYVAVCDLKNKVCYDATTGKECTPNENWTGCAKAEGGKAGFVCTDTDCTYYDKEGNKVGTCGMFKNGKPVPDCYEMFGLTGQTCDGDNKCYNFENGKPTLICDLSARECYNPATDKTCPANADFTGCGYDTGNVPNIKDGTACDEGTGICYTFKNGELISQCTLGKDCGAITDGYLCGGDGCSIIKDGKDIMVCSIGKGICFNKDGKECKPNATYTACSDGSVLGFKTGLVCDDAGCTYYDNNGYAQGTCTDAYDCYKGFKLTGEFCDGGTVCYTFEKGVPTAFCNKADGKCFDSATGKECTPNAAFTGCAADSGSGVGNSYQCANEPGALCTIYGEDGKEQGTCYSNGSGGCIEGSGEEIVCYVGFTDCTIYKDGNKQGQCIGNGSGGCIEGKGEEVVCYKGNTSCTIYKDGKAQGQCTPNANYTGCKEESGSTTQNGLVCDGFSCQYYEGGKPTGDSCNSNGAGGCIEGKGEEIVCINGICNIYQDGNVAYICKKGSSGEDGCDRNGLVCNYADCYEYTYGSADKTTHCYNNGSGGCIKGEGTEMGYCESDGSSCKVYVNGKYSYACKPKYSGADGCDRNGMVCEDGKTECYNYEFGKSTGESCHSNGNGGCIKGKGDEMVCIAGKCNMYKDGQWVNSCVANTAGTGCDSGAVQNGFICIGTECKEYVDGEVVSSCYNNGTGGCIEGKGEEFACYNSGDCIYYVDGKKQYSCIKGYAGEGGCDLNGYICPDKYCYEYKYGNKTGNSCYSNNAGTGCITGKGAELGWCDGDLCRVFVEGVDSYSCQKGSDKDNGCDRNGQVCDGINCAQYVFGLKQAGNTCYRTYSGGGCITGKGTELGYCGNTDGSCNIFIEGKKQYSCVKGSNKAGGCDRNGLVCEDGKYCQEYLYGKELSSCSANYAGNACITGKGMEVGECSTDTPSQCTVFKEGKQQYSCQKGSSASGGCDRNGFVCDGITCADYVYGATQEGTACYRTYSGGGCITGKGTELGYCGNTDGSCNIFIEGKKQYSCVKGSNKAGGCDRNGLVCSGFSCFDYVYGKAIGSGCYSNGNGGCIEGKGTETVCIKGKCNIYKDGKLVTEGCTANDEGTGCKEDGGSGTNGVVCNAGTCIEYKDGKKTGRTLVAFKEKGYCIEYMDGKETGNTFKLNKEGDGCMV